jgi:hypothetical protein
MGGRKVYGWGEKNGLLRAGWEKEKRGKENKTKQKKKLAGCSWLGGEKEEREREREKKKACCVPAGWVRERKDRERKKEKK